jgi:CDI toxin RNase A-like protein
MDEDQGLRLVLSPVQLAAVLQSAHVNPAEIAMNRFWGGMEVLGGALELVGASVLIATPEPTMLTKVGGGVLVVHGSDTVSTGFRQVWTGQQEKTLTAQTATALAHDLGANPNQAEMAGQIVDTAVPLFVATAVAAERIMAIRAGRIVLQETATVTKSGVNLEEEEVAGGHTIAKHVGQTEAQLRARLVAEPRIPAASSFASIEEAESVISRALHTNENSIRTWATSSGSPGKFVFEYSTSKPLGYGVVRSTNALTQMNKINIVLRKTNIAGKVYFLLTAYPLP